MWRGGSLEASRKVARQGNGGGHYRNPQWKLDDTIYFRKEYLTLIIMGTGASIAPSVHPI